MKTMLIGTSLLLGGLLAGVPTTSEAGTLVGIRILIGHGGHARGYDVARLGYDRGFADGRRRGFADARHHRRFDHRRAREYRRADRGYQGRYGSRSLYRDAYRRGYENGYRSGWNDCARSYDRDRHGRDRDDQYFRDRHRDW